ncbi:MAG: hypothetical protein Q4P66_07010 [Actinomycetaceae bacterium]|nr:hypothetical protein [Actinomycetaceae bacterium]
MIIVGIIVSVLPYFLHSIDEKYAAIRMTTCDSEDVIPKHLATDPAILIDIVSAGIQAGSSIPQVLAGIAQAIGDEDLHVVARALTLSIPWDVAWKQGGVFYGGLHTALRASWHDGVDPLPLLEVAARRIRVERDTHVAQAVEKLAVKLVLPLGLCYLPAFILLGLVPVILSGTGIFS